MQTRPSAVAFQNKNRSIKTIVRATLLCAAGLTAAVITQARADNSGGASYQFDIVQLPLPQALRSYAQIAGKEIIFVDQLLDGAKRATLRGSFTAEAALDKLLEGTGLTYERSPSGAIMIVRKGAATRSSAGYSQTSAVRLAGGDGAVNPATSAAATVKNSSSEERSTAAGADEPQDSFARENQRTIQEIIVTAQKREERLVDTPISMGVLSGEALDASSARDMAEVLRQVAGVSLSGATPGNPIIAVRGVLSGSGTSTTGYYIDEVPFAFVRTPNVPEMNVYDLARIEVLRGPQGTLYGANALNGVVRVLSNDAKLNVFESKGRARVSNTDGGGANWGADLAVNAPLIEDKLAVRGVVSYGHRGGFLSVAPNCFQPCDPGTRHINDTDAQSYRLKATAQLTDSFTIKATAQHGQHDNDASTNATDDLTTPFRSHQPSSLELDLYNLVATYDGAAVSLLSSTSYLTFDTVVRGPIVNVPNFMSGLDARSFSQEIRLTSNFDGPLQFSAGGIYRNTIDTTTQDARTTFPGVYQSKDESEAYGVFSDATYSFFDDKLELTGGLRYFDETLTISHQSGFDPAVALVPTDDDGFDKLTGRAVIAFKPRSDTMLYTSYSTGFRSGMFQSPATLAQVPGLPSVKPDTIKNYEVGAKGQLFGDVLTYDTAVYYMDWEGPQQVLRLPPPLSTNARINAGSSSGWGAEAMITLQASSSLSFYAAANWNGLTIDEDVYTFVSTLNRSVVFFEKGARMNDSPEWTGSAGATLRMASRIDGVDFVGSTHVSYGSPRIQRYLIGADLTETTSGEITELGASLGLEAQRWSLSLYGDNLLNELDAATAVDPQTGMAARIWPRTIGLQATFNY